MIAIEYGSKHNGIFSRYSDRDLLLIHHGWKYVKDEYERFKFMGYDVTVMNDKKALHLSKSGSLFFKHVIEEGKVVSGNVDIYKQLSSVWKPKFSYQDEIDSNIDVLELISILPENKHSLLFVNDLVITSIRNISIRIFASKGVFIFSWEEIFQELHRHGWISSSDINVLTFSRRVKNAYRLKVFCNLQMSFISQLLKIAKKIIIFNNRLTFCNQKSIILNLPDKFSDRSYKQLRAYEVVCSFYKFSADVKNIANMVSNPCYFSSGKVGDDFG